MNNYDIIRRNIRFLRKTYNYTLIDFSKHIGVSKSLVSQIECGYGMFSLDVLIEVVKLFNVSLDDIVFVDIKEKYVVKLEKLNNNN